MALKHMKNLHVPEASEQESICIEDLVSVNELPHMSAKERIKIGDRWMVSMKGTSARFEMEKLNTWQMFKARMRNIRSLNNTEIHVVWRPYIPNYDNDWKLSMVLTWVPGDMQLQSAIMPLHMHSHVIFYPNHSTPIGPSDKLPWIIDFVIENADISHGIKIADIWIELHGLIEGNAAYGGTDQAKIISLSPLGEHYNGITINRPYKFKDPWNIRGYMLSFSSHQEKNKLLLLQELGFDLQGLTMCSLLRKVLESITSCDLKNRNNDSTRSQVLIKIAEIVGVKSICPKEVDSKKALKGPRHSTSN